MYEVEYIDEIHTYLVNGMIVPSVTQLLQKRFGSMYDNVPRSILMDKATFGESVHKSIENIENGVETTVNGLYERLCVEQYMKLKEKYNINAVRTEMLVHCEDKYAGRLDMIADVNCYRCLCDIKTTAKLNKEYLSWQLSLYAYALKKMNVRWCNFHKFYCIWLPKKELGQLVEIERISDKRIEAFLKEYL